MKIDPHRHLGGSISTKCIWNIIQMKGYTYLAGGLEDVRRAMTFNLTEPKDFHRFLDKFKILDEIQWDEELIEESIKCICQDLEDEGIDFCWLDFSINKYMHLKWHKADAIKFIYNCFEQYRPGRVGLVLSLKYESLRESQRQYASLIEDPEMVDVLMGLDLVGDESYFDSRFYEPIFKEWKKIGKMVRAHVGESQPASNIEAAIDRMSATNIAHGIKCIEDTELVELAKDNDVVFDTAITSNYLTGVWADPDYHPILYMMNQGLKVTLGSDDPVQCSTTLDKEYEVFRELASKSISSVHTIDMMCKKLQDTTLESTLKYVPALKAIQ